MPGSIGGTDIWKVSVNQMAPMDYLKTWDRYKYKSDENFPFIADNNVLYFFIKSILWFSGFDVYSANLDTDKKAVNLGMPINSGKDDFSFYIDKENKLGVPI
jgi:hypothetical protein